MFHSSIKSYSILGIRKAKISSCLIKEPGETEEIGKNCPHERGKKSNYCYCCRQTRVEGTWLSYDVDLAAWAGG